MAGRAGETTNASTTITTITILTVGQLIVRLIRVIAFIVGILKAGHFRDVERFTAKLSLQSQGAEKAMLAIGGAKTEIIPLVARLTVDAQRIAYIMSEHFAIAHIHHTTAVEKDASFVDEMTAFDDIALAVDQLVVEEEKRTAGVPEILLLTCCIDL